MDKKDGNILEKKKQDYKEFDEFKSYPTKEGFFLIWIKLNSR